MHILYTKDQKTLKKSLYHCKVTVSNNVCHACKLLSSFITDDTGSLVHLQLVRYHFTDEVHALPQLPHGNSKGSTPYKRQTPSTRELLETAIETNKPKEAFRKVEEISGGFASNETSSSVLPRNSQASTIKRQLFQSQSNYDPIMALVDMHKTEFSGFVRYLQILPSPTCILATDEQLKELVKNCTLPCR